MTRAGTTLILGAGASHPYGFPIGSRLFELIYAQLNEPSGSGSFLEFLEGETSPQDISIFKKAVYYTPISSIDSFLQNHKDNKSFQRIGKLCIAKIINSFEKEEEIFTRSKQSTFKNWYYHLFNQLLPFIDGDPANLPNVPFNFITFNYDRSLEWFFLKSLEHSFNIKSSESQKIAKSFFESRIFHAHGSLGDINELPYSPAENRYGFVLKMAENIEVVFENREKDVFSKISAVLSDSKMVHFIGFGYNRANLQKLNFPKLTSKRDRRKYLAGSRTGLKLIELEEIKDFLFNKSEYYIDFFEDKNLPWDLDAYDYIRNFVRFF